MAGRAETARRNGKKGGRPKGRKNDATLTKEAARARVCQRVYADIDELLDAQLANAKGISHFFLRDDKTKQVP